MPDAAPPPKPAIIRIGDVWKHSLDSALLFRGVPRSARRAVIAELERIAKGKRLDFRSGIDDLLRCAKVADLRELPPHPVLAMPLLTTVASASAGALRGKAAQVDPFTKLLLHFDGADGSTTCTDSSAAARTMTRTGNPEIDTAQSKFGGASGLFNSGRWQAPDDADLELGSNDFTIEMWTRSASWSGTKILCIRGSAADYWTGFWANGTGINFTGTTNNGSYNFSANSAFGTLSNDTWHHIAAARSGNNLYLFLDGVLLSTRVVTGLSVYDFGHGWCVGSSNGGTGAHSGWIDELRISIGIARWTANFTPPTAPY